MLDRDEGGDIVLSGGGGEIFGLGVRLLYPMRERCEPDGRLKHLRKISDSDATVHTQFAVGMMPGFGDGGLGVSAHCIHNFRRRPGMPGF